MAKNNFTNWVKTCIAQLVFHSEILGICQKLLNNIRITKQEKNNKIKSKCGNNVFLTCAKYIIRVTFSITFFLIF